MMEVLDEENYTDFAIQEGTTDVLPKLTRQPAMSARRYRLSLSPLDSLQAEFKKYNKHNQNESRDRLRRSSRVPDTSNLLHHQSLHTVKAHKRADLLLPSDTDHSNFTDDDEELPDALSHIPDWSFLKDSGIVEHLRESDCPSLATGSTISSRNSSTRSTRSFKRDTLDLSEKGVCSYPGCGRTLRDLATHLLTHQAERPEKCPVESCEYHLKGFARAYDRVRHTITHFREVMVCGFCPETIDSAQRTFNRCDLFLKHLVNAHDAEPVPSVRRDEHYRNGKSSRKPLNGQEVATCGLCSEPFDAQGFYDHLRGCALRQVTRDSVAQQHNHSHKPSHRNLKSEADQEIFSSCSSSSNSTSRIASDIRLPSRSLDSYLSKSALLADHKENSVETDTESKDIAELTASSRCLSLTSSHDEVARSSEEETDWTEDAGSPASMTDAENLRPMLSPLKQQVVERLMQEFHRIFDKMMRTHHGSGGTGSTGQGGYYAGSSGSSTYSSSSFVSRKRSLSGGSTPPPDDGDDSHKRRRPDPKLSGKQAIRELRFACPYYKRNPGRHQTFTSCRDPGFITVARLKEHLYRRHLLPIQCNRCCATFVNEPLLREHQRNPLGCEIKEQVPLEGFDKDQERKLKSKKRSQVNQSEHDKWKGVYRILFPDDKENDMPSPYIEYQPCNAGQSTESNIVRFQEFSRLELPRLVRRTLEVTVEEEAQPLEERLKDRLVDIVRECQTQLITMFQSTQGQSTDSESLKAYLAPQEIGESVKPSVCSSKSSSQVSVPSTREAQPLPAPTGPFQNFDSLHAINSADFISIPAQYTEYDVLPQKTSSPPPLEGDSSTPDSGYDSTWNNPPIPPESLAPNIAFLQTASHPHLPQQQAAYASNAILLDSEYVDLGGYYGLFQNRNPTFDAAMMDPSWAYLNAHNGNGGLSSMGNGPLV